MEVIAKMMTVSTLLLSVACTDNEISFSELENKPLELLEQPPGEDSPEQPADEPSRPTPPVEPPPEPPPVVVVPVDPPVDPPIDPPVDPPQPPAVGPQIVITESPTDRPSGSDAYITYQVVTGSSPVSSVQCWLNSQPFSCSSTGERLVVSDLAVGSYEFMVKAVDQNNLSDQKQVIWSVFQNFEKIVQPIVVNDEDDQVDVLVVIDNSRSMRFEQESMVEKIENFLIPLQGLDWRLAVTITDPRVNHEDVFRNNPSVKTGVIINGDGQLQKMENGQYWITSDMPLSEAVDQFESVIIRQEDWGWYREQGMKMVTRALQKAVNPLEDLHSVHQNFFRDEAALAVIMISDEDENLDEIHHPGSQPEDHGQELLDTIASIWGPDKLFQFHSIITRPGDDDCQVNSNANQFGFLYEDMTELTGGTIGSVCEEDYSQQLSLIGQDVSEPNTLHELSCVPMDINGDSNQDISIAEASSGPVPNFILDQALLKFSSALQPGVYSVEYFCPLN